MKTLEYPGNWLFQRITGVPIRTKIIGMVLGAVLVIGLAMTLAVRARLADDLTSSLEERGVAIARDLAARSTNIVLTDNTFALYQLVRDTLENNLDVRYALVQDAYQQAIVHSFPQTVPKDLLSLNWPDATESYNLLLFDTNEGRMIDFAVPIFEDQAGVARVGLSLTRMDSEVTQATWQLLSITAIAMLIGTFIALLLTRVLTRPVLDLVEVSRRVGQGDLETRAYPRMADEIGELAHAFNAMTENLQASHSDLIRKLRELATLNATATAISSTLGLRQMLQAALDKVLEVMELQAGWIFLENPIHPANFQLTVKAGLSQAFILAETNHGFEKCICTQVLHTVTPMVVNDISKECKHINPEIIASEGLACHVSVPLISRDRVIGVLNVASRKSRTYNRDDLALLDSIGRQIGVATENARLWEELKEKEVLRGQLLEKIITTQETERQRLARELHDEAGQALTSLKFRLRSLEKQSEPSKAYAQLQALRDLVGQIQVNLHDLATELHPPALDELGLIAAIQQFSSHFASHTSLHVDIQTLGLEDERLGSQVELTAYRLIQEALTNAARHAEANNISIMLEKQDKQIIVIVDDDGIGFDNLEQLKYGTGTKHLGIHSMQERVELLGGIFTVESQSGQGTTVLARIPLVEPTYSPNLEEATSL